MDGIIRIKTPEELKRKYQNDKKSLEKIGLEISAYQIEKALEDDNISLVLGSINRVTEKTKRRSYMDKTGFFKDFPDWLDFALLQIIEGRKLGFEEEINKEEIYAALFESQHQLLLTVRDEDYDGIITRARIIKSAEETIREEYSFCDTAQINELCSLFVDIGLNNQDPEQIADFSYDTYQKHKSLVLTKK